MQPCTSTWIDAPMHFVLARPPPSPHSQVRMLRAGIDDVEPFDRQLLEDASPTGTAAGGGAQVMDAGPPGLVTFLGQIRSEAEAYLKALHRH